MFFLLTFVQLLMVLSFVLFWGPLCGIGQFFASACFYEVFLRFLFCFFPRLPSLGRELFCVSCTHAGHPRTTANFFPLHPPPPFFKKRFVRLPRVSSFSPPSAVQSIPAGVVKKSHFFACDPFFPSPPPWGGHPIIGTWLVSDFPTPTYFFLRPLLFSSVIVTFPPPLSHDTPD